MMEPATALVLSAGGMFGAWQAGAWQGLAQWLKPAMVVGASAGSLNAWAIAGGIDPEDLGGIWLSPELEGVSRFRPRPHHLCDGRPLYESIRKLHAMFRPKVEVGIVAVELRTLRPRLFRNDEITWEHLAASCAVLLWYPQVKLGGRWYTDGGLLGTVPLWAAPRMGASEAVVVNALPRLPSVLVRSVVRSIRAVAPRAPEAPAGFPVKRIEPSRPLGSMQAALHWRRETIEAWLRQGRADAAAARQLQ